MTTEQKISNRALNRALITRQLLAKRADYTVGEATAHLVGLQSQIPNPPYIGLWTRLAQFERQQLTQALINREIVRAPLMRSTLHLVTAADHQRFRETIRPALIKGLRSFHGKDGRELDPEPLVKKATELLRDRPLTMGELKGAIQPLEPNRSPDALAYGVRTYLPLVQDLPAHGAAARERVTYRLNRG